ncbi:MAG: methionine--tRNA ligase [Candidatus Magasanikbacteria bacterium RIFCSPHIGHO2_02_FULL_51_14]|uniref:Methionine--tRNA ligase n=1 Tax=Candidatus Magasanikbacteria bacterium RIFCSPHIGHO2_02_FULL_51_14 TaxID=1798683 RepID=A0A1F6MF41_9BACT|nr:MAG: methionine--tRNA ligase [Candidatus Magasanikbacteria bacterium RIFCSPHIGHO2_02_FULL_51_14]
MQRKPYYITATIPYVNADPHIGFALEIVQADVLARYHRLLGDEVLFNTGTDEHGLKIYRGALDEGLDPQAYTDKYAARFDALKQALNLSYTHFIRTTDEHHVAAAQEFWSRCDKSGDIYKKNYQVKYCVGCELEKTESELVDGRCPIHPNLDLELIDEENYFFRFSKYQRALMDLYSKRKNFVIPEHRQREIENFVKAGLQDFSISRLKAKMPWGVPVPNDPEHVMYVWFDALVNYISTLGWPEDHKNFEKFWPGIQVAGKDNLRQQSAMWQAMLMSAGLPPSKQIFIHGFITSEGQKMSKSLGNVVDPFAVVEKYGTDAVRYFLLGGLPASEDGDWSNERFEEFYNAQLANGIGNLTARVLTMVEKYSGSKVPAESQDVFGTAKFWKEYDSALAEYNFELAVKLVNELVGRCDEMISMQKPWEQAKAGEDISALLYQLTETLRHIALALLPVIPESAEKILTQLGIDVASLDTFEKEQTWGRLEERTAVKKGEALFPRLKNDQ